MKFSTRSRLSTVGSDISDGDVISGLAEKYYNTRIHGKEIRDRRVYRWQHETDRKVIEQANEVFKLLEDYCEFWGIGGKL